jgi:hypothetical protein
LRPDNHFLGLSYREWSERQVEPGLESPELRDSLIHHSASALGGYHIHY